MKVLCLILLVFSSVSFNSSCYQASATMTDNINANVTTLSNESDANVYIPPKHLKTDEVKLEELNRQNEKFREVPVEWEKVDFKNFRYDFGKIVNGEYESEEDKKYVGGLTFSFGDMFYVDLVGDKKKEAIVFIWEVLCGGSCNGGAIIPYFYKIQNGKVKLIDEIRTGSRSGGCFIKSFRLENKEIYLEQFGRCKKDSSFYEDREFICKFCVSGLTKSVYSFNKSRLDRKSVEEIESENVEINGYLPEISIND